MLCSCSSKNCWSNWNRKPSGFGVRHLGSTSRCLLFKSSSHHTSISTSELPNKHLHKNRSAKSPAFCHFNQQGHLRHPWPWRPMAVPLVSTSPRCPPLERESSGSVVDLRFLWLLFFETPNILGFLWVDFHGSFLAKPCSFLRIFSVFGKAFFWLDGFLTYILAGDQQAKLYGAKRGDIIGRYSAGIVEYTTKINQQYNTVRAKHMVEYPKKYGQLLWRIWWSFPI